MKSIQNRLLLLMTLTISTVIGFTYLCATSYLKFSNINSEYRQSISLVQTVDDLTTHSKWKETVQNLQTIREGIQPESRKEALSNIIQAYNDHNPRLLKKRQKFFLKNETEFRRFATSTIEYLHSRVIYYGGIALGALLFAFTTFFFYTKSSVFRPLASLSQKMMDFLNNKYSYQFTVPAQTEVGLLHATFNSLAQRVLANMEELKSLDKAKSEFLSIASHELRTPLTSIKGSLSLLNNGVAGKVPDPAQNLVTIAETESDRLIRLINDILDLAKIEARRFPLNKNWYSLYDIIDASAQGISGLAQKANVILDYGENSHIYVEVDRDRIQQVITNLLSNAIKYSPDGGTVSIIIDIDREENIIVEVTDQGKGIAPEDQELIFQQFRQATGPENPLVKGTGLGLAIAKALIDEHQGEIGVRSLPGDGSTFYFTLPKWKFEKAEDRNNHKQLGGAA
ncbi:MAG: HAMP domain-containing histidine kinase [Bdellovibrionales bacterium]|nr:HAMP domain-containing histidine kinase [Bdellovibrionales bacterium]